MPWSVRALGSIGTPPFYPLSSFKVFTSHSKKVEPLAFPPQLLLSTNYFAPSWWDAAPRRIKNVVVVLEWCPNPRGTSPVHSWLKSAGEHALAGGEGAGERDGSGEGNGDAEADSEADADAVRIPTPAGGDGAADADADAGPGDAERQPEPHRYSIAVSLAEAEGLRALLHSLNAREAGGSRGAGYGDASAASPIGGATFCLRFGGDAVEASPRHRTGPAYQSISAQQCFRIFDAELDYSPAEVAVALRTLQANPPRRRQQWFEAVRACRRRQPRDWREAPISRIFTSSDEVALAQEQAPPPLPPFHTLTQPRAAPPPPH